MHGFVSPPSHSKISNEKLLLSIRKSAMKTMSLPIQKLAAKSCDAADSEISNDGEVVSGFTFFFCVYKFNILYLVFLIVQDISSSF
jgi:hypothetical protein